MSVYCPVAPGVDEDPASGVCFWSGALCGDAAGDSFLRLPLELRPCCAHSAWSQCPLLT